MNNSPIEKIAKELQEYYGNHLMSRDDHDPMQLLFKALERFPTVNHCSVYIVSKMVEAANELRKYSPNLTQSGDFFDEHKLRYEIELLIQDGIRELSEILAIVQRAGYAETQDKK